MLHFVCSVPPHFQFQFDYASGWQNIYTDSDQFLFPPFHVQLAHGSRFYFHTLYIFLRFTVSFQWFCICTSPFRSTPIIYIFTSIILLHHTQWPSSGSFSKSFRSRLSTFAIDIERLSYSARIHRRRRRRFSASIAVALALALTRHFARKEITQKKRHDELNENESIMWELKSRFQFDSSAQTMRTSPADADTHSHNHNHKHRRDVKCISSVQNDCLSLKCRDNGYK